MMDGSEQSKSSRAGRSARMTSEDRKLRNRLSQKAFRARQAMRIKELEERLESKPVSETERISELEDRNAFMANKLFECHKKLESLQVTIKALSESTAEALDMVVNKSRIKDPPGNEDGDGSSPGNAITARSTTSEASHNEDMEATAPASAPKVSAGGVGGSLVSSLPIDTHHLRAETPNWSDLRNDYDEIPEDFQHALQAAVAHDPEIFASLGSFDNSSPPSNTSFVDTSNGLIWDNTIPDPVMQQHLSFSFPQIGPNAYSAHERSGAVLVRGPHGMLRRTNSPWSDHITTLEYFLRQKWKNLGLMNRKGRFDGLSNSASFMLSTFICLSWPTMTAWHSYTRAHIPVGSLMAWRLDPTPELYEAIDPAFRPTKLQMAISHPAIIDWIPYGTLRDKLIVYHSANPHLDDVICEMGNSYVMEVDLSRLIAGLRPTRGYVGVWDLIRSIAPEAATYTTGANLFGPDLENSPETIDDFDEEEQNTPARTLPAPNAAALFESKSLALEAFKLIGMHKGPSNFLLDPLFFERHPELHDSNTHVIARGVPLRPGDRKFITTPRPLDLGVLGRYKELSSWSLSLSAAMRTAN